MIVILANRGDPAATSLALRWAGHQARILTARDLSCPGWCQRVDAPDEGTAVISGQLVPNRDITGVLTLAPCIFPQELPYIALADQSYVAAEMTAFLLSWLSCLPCPVLNPPTASSLAGPDFRREHWLHAALQAGIPIQSFRRSAPHQPPPPLPSGSITLTVVGRNVLGEAHSTLGHHALSLARNARVQLLAVHFSSPHADALFLDADSSPSLIPGDDHLADAILAYLQAGSHA